MQVLNTGTTTAYRGVLRSTYQIASAEGVLNLWRGMSSVVVGAGPAHAVYFATYEAVKHAMGGNQAGVHHPLAAGEMSPPDTSMREKVPRGERLGLLTV